MDKPATLNLCGCCVSVDIPSLFNTKFLYLRIFIRGRFMVVAGICVHFSCDASILTSKSLPYNVQASGIQRLGICACDSVQDLYLLVKYVCSGNIQTFSTDNKCRPSIQRQRSTFSTDDYATQWSFNFLNMRLLQVWTASMLLLKMRLLQAHGESTST